MHEGIDELHLRVAPVDVRLFLHEPLSDGVFILAAGEVDVFTPAKQNALLLEALLKYLDASFIPLRPEGHLVDAALSKRLALQARLDQLHAPCSITRFPKNAWLDPVGHLPV